MLQETLHCITFLPEKPTDPVPDRHRPSLGSRGIRTPHKHETRPRRSGRWSWPRNTSATSRKMTCSTVSPNMCPWPSLICPNCPVNDIYHRGLILRPSLKIIHSIFRRTALLLYRPVSSSRSRLVNQRLGRPLLLVDVRHHAHHFGESISPYRRTGSVPGSCTSSSGPLRPPDELRTLPRTPARP